MSHILVIGSGAIGTRVARQFSARGYEVRLASRRGSQVPGVRALALDATDAPEVARQAEGAAALINCANPPYDRWPTHWPPIADSLLAAAESSGATLVTLSNLYPYGRVDAPMSPDTAMAADYLKAQVRAQMWRDALAAHEAGRIRAVEVRASDFIGPDAQGVFGLRVVPRLLAGRSVRVLGSLDQVHSWSYVDDVAATLVECALRPASWGRVWHVATNAPRTQREVIGDLCAAAGIAPVRAGVYTPTLLRLAGLVNPLARELPHTLYQFTRPFVIDDERTRQELGLLPTPWPEVIEATLAAYRLA